MTMRFILALVCAAAFDATAGRAQVAPPDSVQMADTTSLGALQDSAVSRDPRARELALLAAQSRLRLANIRAESKPTVAVEGQAQYQSDVARIPITLPGGIKVPTPPHDTYDAHVAVGQQLYDPALRLRRAVEESQLAEQEAQLRAQLYPLRRT